MDIFSRPGSLSHSADADALCRAEPPEQPETEPRASFGLQHEQTQLPGPAATNLPSSQMASPTTAHSMLLCDTAECGILTVASNKLYCTEIHFSALAGFSLAAARQSNPPIAKCSLVAKVILF